MNIVAQMDSVITNELTEEGVVYSTVLILNRLSREQLQDLLAATEKDGNVLVKVGE